VLTIKNLYAKVLIKRGGYMKNKSENTTIPNRFCYILEHYTNAFIPDTVQEMADELGINEETLNNYMYRLNLYGNNYKVKKKRLYAIIYNLRENHFTLDELSAIFDIKKSNLVVYLSNIKKERRDKDAITHSGELVTKENSD
jgi:hypothetical protein